MLITETSLSAVHSVLGIFWKAARIGKLKLQRCQVMDHDYIICRGILTNNI